MIRSSFLRRTLVLVISTILLFALLTAGIYSLVSPQIFAANKIDDMLPKGRFIAENFAEYISGKIPSTLLVALIGSNTAQWDATVWVVDTNGDTILRTQQKSGRRVGTLPEGLWSLLPQVLSGEECTHIGVLNLEDASSSTRRNAAKNNSSPLGSLKNAAGDSSDSNDSAELINGSMVAVAVPIVYGEEVQGAVVHGAVHERGRRRHGQPDERPDALHLRRRVPDAAHGLLPRDPSRAPHAPDARRRAGDGVG